MSHEAVCSVLSSVSQRSLSEFLAAADYKKVSISPFWYGKNAVSAHSWYETRDYQSHTGVYAEVAFREGRCVVYLRSNAGASYWDLKKLNDTIREIRRRFQRWF